jgi:mycoredoxin
MTQTSTPITMYTTTWCPDCKAAKRALDSKGLSYTEVNIEEVEDAAEIVMRVNGGKRSVPTLVYGDVAQSLSSFSIVKMNDFLNKAGLA